MSKNFIYGLEYELDKCSLSLLWRWRWASGEFSSFFVEVIITPKNAFENVRVYSSKPLLILSSHRLETEEETILS
jgi:hypothetical protein